VVVMVCLHCGLWGFVGSAVRGRGNHRGGGEGLGLAGRLHRGGGEKCVEVGRGGGE